MRAKPLRLPVVIFAATLLPAAAAQAQSGRLIHQKDLPLRIVDSGEWRVAEDLVTRGKLLTIAAPEVTLDLGGRIVDGGVWVEAGDGLTVHSGTFLADCPYYAINGTPPDCAVAMNLLISGTCEGVAIDLGDGATVRDVTMSQSSARTVVRVGHDGNVSDIHVTGETDQAETIIGGDGCIVTSCTLDEAGGIRVGDGSQVSACNVLAWWATPIAAGDDSRVSGCRAEADTGSDNRDIGNVGIRVGDGGEVVSCTAIGPHAIQAGRNASVIGCSTQAYGSGVSAGPGSLVSGCNVTYADEDPTIRVSGDSVVIGNRIDSRNARPHVGIEVRGDRNRVEGNWIGLVNIAAISVSGADNAIIGNTMQGSGGGIDLYGRGNRIEDNQIQSVVSRAIWVSTPGNAIVRNTLRQIDGDPLNIAPGNAVGEIIDTTNGGVVPPGNCWANVIE